VSSYLQDYVRAYALPHRLCDDLVELFDSGETVLQSPGDYRRCREHTNIDSSPLWTTVRTTIKALIEAYRDHVQVPTFLSANTIEAPNVFRYDVVPAGEPPHHFHQHADAWDMASASRVISIIAYLNDVAEGGETVFSFGLTAKPQKGLTIVFPSAPIFEHKALAPISGPKYVLVGWVHFDGEGHRYRVHP
jgi:hypothetical protein